MGGQPSFVMLNFNVTLSHSTFEFNLRAGSTFSVPVCNVSPRHWVNKAGATRLTRSDFRLNLIFLKGQR